MLNVSAVDRLHVDVRLGVVAGVPAATKDDKKYYQGEFTECTLYDPPPTFPWTARIAPEHGFLMPRSAIRHTPKELIESI